MGGNGKRPDGWLVPPLPIAYSDADIRRWKDAIIEINSRGFDKLMAYTNLMTLAGYAGAFTLWNFTRDQLTRSGTALVAIFLGVSLTIFVVFEIWQMLQTMRFARMQRDILAANHPIPQMLDEIAKAGLEEATFRLKVILPWWQLAFRVTVGYGFIGAALLFYSFFATLLGGPPL